MKRIQQLLSVDVMFNSHVLRQPEQEIIAQAVVDHLVQILAGDHQAHCVDVDVDQEVVLERGLFQSCEDVVLLLEESGSLTLILTEASLWINHEELSLIRRLLPLHH